MTTQDPFLKRWGESRKLGRLKYGITQGIIFGVMVFILSNLIKLRVEDFNTLFLTFAAVKGLFVWLVVGILGHWTVMWSLNEYIYRKKVERLNTTKEK